MKPKTTLILLIVALLIGAFIWYDYKFLRDTDSVLEQEKRVFPNLKTTEITKLELQNTNGVIVVEKADDKWNMLQPYQVRASKSVVESILTDLEFLDADRVMEEKEWKEGEGTLASYGLEKPRIQATITFKDKSKQIKLGNESAVGGNVYARVENRNEIYVIGKSLADKLNKTVDELRDRSVVEFDPFQLSKLELKSGNKQIELSKVDDPDSFATRWRVTRPIQARADKDKIDEIARKLADLKVDTFVTEEPKDLKQYGLDEPAQEVSLFTKGVEGARIVQFGASPTNDTAKVYCKRKSANSIFTVSKDVLTNLTFQVNDLRDRELVHLDTAKIGLVEIDVGGQTIKISHTDDRWKFADAPAVETEAEACKDLVDLVADAKIQEFVADVVTDLAQYGLEKPFAQVVFKEAKTAGTTTTNQLAATVESGGTNAVATSTSAPGTNWVTLVAVQVGKTEPQKGIVYVKRADEPFIYGLSTNFVAELPRTALDLRNRTILDVPEENISKLEIERSGVKVSTEKVTVKDESGSERKEWKITSPAQGVLDVDAVKDVVSSLAQIRAEKLIAEDPANLATYGLDQPSLVAAFVAAATTNPPVLTHTLLVGKEAAESEEKLRFAMLKGQPLVFLLPSQTYEGLSKELLTKPEEKPAEQLPAAPAQTNQPPAAAAPEPAPPPAPAATNVPPPAPQPEPTNAPAAN